MPAISSGPLSALTCSSVGTKLNCSRSHAPRPASRPQPRRYLIKLGKRAHLADLQLDVHDFGRCFDRSQLREAGRWVPKELDMQPGGTVMKTAYTVAMSVFAGVALGGNRTRRRPCGQ